MFVDFLLDMEDDINSVLFSVPELRIAGEKEVYAKAGSTVQLKCYVQSTATSHWTIQW